MKGIKRHSKEDRRRVVAEMIPLIKRKFGDNLIGLAYDASMARDEDADYSDVEIIAYLKKPPDDQYPKAMVKIYDGMLIEFEWLTPSAEIKKVREVTADWYIAGSDFQKAIINEQLIDEINRYAVPDLEKKCRDRAAAKWYEVQESTGKLFNAIDQENAEGIPLLFFDTCLHMLIVLSFINAIPYTTFSRFVAQARKLPIKPASLNKLLDILCKGKYTDWPALRNIVEKVFEEFEKVFEDLGYDLYYDNFDPNLPHKDFFNSII